MAAACPWGRGRTGTRWRTPGRLFGAEVDGHPRGDGGRDPQPPTSAAIAVQLAAGGRVAQRLQPALHRRQVRQRRRHPVHPEQAVSLADLADRLRKRDRAAVDLAGARGGHGRRGGRDGGSWRGGRRRGVIRPARHAATIANRTSSASSSPVGRPAQLRVGRRWFGRHVGLLVLRLISRQHASRDLASAGTVGVSRQVDAKRGGRIRARDRSRR